MTSEGAVFDLGYERYSGPRLGDREVFWRMVIDGLRKSVGIGKRARSKAFPFALLALAILPAIGVVVIQVVANIFGIPLGEELLLNAPEYFDWTAQLIFFFVAVAVPNLLIPDRVEGVLLVYTSRPPTINRYLVARLVAMAISVGTFLMVPQLVLLVGEGLISDNFFGHMVDNLAFWWRVPLAALFYLAVNVAAAAAIAAYVNNRGAAIAVYIIAMNVLSGVGFGLSSINRFFSLIAIQFWPPRLRDWIFDRPSPEEVPGTDVPVVAVLGTTLAFVALAVWLIMRRYRRLI